eukprot:SAG25_NODE_1915_length_2147_cov_2.166992_2_plen_59_part_00
MVVRTGEDVRISAISSSGHSDQIGENNKRLSIVTIGENDQNFVIPPKPAVAGGMFIVE